MRNGLGGRWITGAAGASSSGASRAAVNVGAGACFGGAVAGDLGRTAAAFGGTAPAFGGSAAVAAAKCAEIRFAGAFAPAGALVAAAALPVAEGATLPVAEAGLAAGVEPEGLVVGLAVDAEAFAAGARPEVFDAAFTGAEVFGDAGAVVLGCFPDALPALPLVAAMLTSNPD